MQKYTSSLNIVSHSLIHMLNQAIMHIRNAWNTHVIFVPNSYSNLFNKFQIYTVYSYTYSSPLALATHTASQAHSRYYAHHSPLAPVSHSLIHILTQAIYAHLLNARTTGVYRGRRRGRGMMNGISGNWRTHEPPTEAAGWWLRWWILIANGSRRISQLCYGIDESTKSLKLVVPNADLVDIINQDIEILRKQHDMLKRKQVESNALVRVKQSKERHEKAKMER